MQNRIERRERLTRLMKAYRSSSKEFQATSYWAAYEDDLIDLVGSIDTEQLRSGKSPVLETFGFNDITFKYQSKKFLPERLFLWALTAIFGNFREILPYGMKLSNIREMAFHHCRLAGKIAGAKPIDDLCVSDFGRPADLFSIGGNYYTMSFLNYYIRYCFAMKNYNFTGKEVFVELGSGSGYQVEVIKKIHPELTILCFDLPSQILLCEEYLRNVFGSDAVVSSDKTLEWSDLKSVCPGKIHFFGNWKWPLLKNYDLDIFWNAASFGEMEPQIVKNYLKYIKDSTKHIYLLQARRGKETSGNNSVVNPIMFQDYVDMLEGFTLIAEQDAWHAHKRLSASGGYFEAWWSSVNARGTRLSDNKNHPC